MVVNGGSDQWSELGVPIFFYAFLCIPCVMGSRLELRSEFSNHLSTKAEIMHDAMDNDMDNFVC